jgi:hypothetical protein
MATKFVPLTLQGLDEGEFLDDADAEFAALQKRLVAFVRQYGDKADKAVAELNIKLTIKCEDPQNNLCSVKSAFALKIPCRPASVSAAIMDSDPEGDEGLFVQRSGSSAGNPRQQKLATRDGRCVDMETGEPIEA